MFELLKNATLWISGQTGLTTELVTIIETMVVIPLLGALTKKIDWAKYEKTVYVKFYGWAQSANDAILKVIAVGYVWEKWLEPYFIKHLAGAFRVIAQIPMAVTAGLNSRGESLVETVETGRKPNHTSPRM